MTAFPVIMCIAFYRYGININEVHFDTIPAGGTNKALETFSFNYIVGYGPDSVTIENPITFYLDIFIDGILHWSDSANYIPSDTTKIVDKSNGIKPAQVALLQNYPNPFNPSTTIEFSLPKSEFVELKVFNIFGKEVSTLVSKKLNQGNHTYTFDGKNLASGIYYYSIQAGDFHQVRKMVLLK